MKTGSMSNVTPESLFVSSFPADYNDTNGTIESMLSRSIPPPLQANIGAIVGLSILFSIIVLVGVIGNGLVIFVILADRKMRQSVTNIFIMNLAIADFFIMVFGIPELVQFIMNRGWILGGGLCKFNRFTLVVSLYASVMSLVSVCIERGWLRNKSLTSQATKLGIKQSLANVCHMLFTGLLINFVLFRQRLVLQEKAKWDDKKLSQTQMSYR